MPRSSRRSDALGAGTSDDSSDAGTPVAGGSVVVPVGGSTPYAKLLPWLLLVGGAIGLTAALVLTVEKIALLRDPAYVPSCSISPILSCGSVMTKPQAEAFGFPNPLLGIAGFAVVMTVGAALLAGASFRRWFWVGLQVGATFGVVFVHWLIFQSLYRIQALCPYCMAVWAVTVPIFWYVTLHNLGHLPVPASVRRGVAVVSRFHTVPLTIWAVVLLTLIGEQFWPYWRTLP
ncbi:vitamin K epoxide reductase family protein [Kribbella endophytica]